MNSPNEQEVEKLLRGSPRPEVPRGLKEKLVAQARSTAKPPAAVVSRHQESWLRRWWPALASLSASLACAVVMTVQQGQIREIKQALRSVAANVMPAEPIAEPKAVDTSSPANSSAKQQEEEIAQLSEQVAKLSADISQIEQMQIQNKALHTQLAALPPRGLTSDELASLQKAKEDAMEIRCINNLKQMGLAVRVWQGDNNDMLPPDIISMSNELSTPKILVCPSDTNRPVAANFSSYSDANCSYEFLAASGGTNEEPTRVLFRCPIHGAVCLCDGSVQKGMAKTHPEWFVQRDGKLYFEPPPGQ